MRSSSSRGARSGTTTPTSGSSRPTTSRRAETYAVFDEAVVRNTRRIDDALAEGGLDLVAHVDDGNGNHPRLRRLLVDLLEEYARHTGHADLLREAVDGRVGEDPPEDWTPAWLA